MTVVSQKESYGGVRECERGRYESVYLIKTREGLAYFLRTYLLELVLGHTLSHQKSLNIIVMGAVEKKY